MFSFNQQDMDKLSRNSIIGAHAKKIHTLFPDSKFTNTRTEKEPNTSVIVARIDNIATAKSIYPMIVEVIPFWLEAARQNKPELFYDEIVNLPLIINEDQFTLSKEYNLLCEIIDKAVLYILPSLIALTNNSNVVSTLDKMKPTECWQISSDSVALKFEERSINFRVVHTESISIQRGTNYIPFDANRVKTNELFR